MTDFFRAYEMDGSGYTPHLFNDKEHCQAWVKINHRHLFIKAEGLRGRCRPAIDHCGECNPRIESARLDILTGAQP